MSFSVKSKEVVTIYWLFETYNALICLAGIKYRCINIEFDD